MQVISTNQGADHCCLFKLGEVGLSGWEVSFVANSSGKPACWEPSGECLIPEMRPRSGASRRICCSLTSPLLFQWLFNVHNQCSFCKPWAPCIKNRSCLERPLSFSLWGLIVLSQWSQTGPSLNVPQIATMHNSNQSNQWQHRSFELCKIWMV